MSHARYLGDAVYASWDEFGIILTTGDHDPEKATNKIVLEPEVVAALVQYVVDLKNSLKTTPLERPEQI